jgi:spermidine/putrescine transport system ATP-binding protein
VGVTFVFVTHDQEEALTMSDRLAVMDEGVLQQVGHPAEIYDRPVNGFVAGFIGTTNLLAGEVSGSEVRVDSQLSIPLHGHGDGFREGDHVTVSVRPERVQLARSLDGDLVRFPAEVTDVIFLGASTHVAVALPDDRRLVAIHTHIRGDEPLHRGDRVEVGWWPDDALLLADGRSKTAPDAPETSAART